MAVVYSDFLYYSGTNTPIVGEPVTVKLAGTDTLATLYASDASEISNPVYSDIHGGFSFYVNANLSYDIYVQGTKQADFTSAVNTDKADKNNTILTATSIGDALQVETGGDVKVFQRIKTPILTIGSTDVTATAVEINALSGSSVSNADLVKLHATTATAAELNKLSGTPAGLTSTELGYCDGLTSNAQAQIDSKAGLDSPTFSGNPIAPNLKINGTLSADPQTLDIYYELTLPVSDESGGGLSLLGSARRTNIGNQIFSFINVSFPVNSNGNSNMISFTFDIDTNYSGWCAPVSVNNAIKFAKLVAIGEGVSNGMQIIDSSGTALTNSQLSGVSFVVKL